MVNQYSSVYNQAIETPSPPSAVSLAGDSRESMVDEYSSEITRPSRPQVHPRPCLWQGTAENRW